MLSNRKIYFVFLGFVSLIAVAVAYLTTSAFGAGVGTDSATYLSTAENLLQGRGLVNFSGQPLLRWPPLYPYTLALLSLLTKWGALAVGRYLNVLLFGAAVWLGGVLFIECFRDSSAPGGLLWAYLGCLVLLTSSSLLSISATIDTDLLFVVLVWAFLIAVNHYLTSHSIWSLLWMVILAGFAAFNRLPGVTLTATGFFMILYAHRGNLRRGLVTGLVFAILSILPLAGWVIGHNYLQYHTLLGNYLIRSDFPLANLVNSARKIAHWFFSYNRDLAIISATFVGILIVAMVLTSNAKGWRRLMRRISIPPVLTSLVFICIYLLFLIFTANPTDTFYPDYDRYQVVLLAPLLIILFTGFEELSKGIISLIGKHALPGLDILLVCVLFAAWLVYPVLKTYKYIQITMAEGEPRYNLYNTRALRQSKVVQAIRDLSGQSGITFYSNYPAAVWFYTRQDAQPSPRGEIAEDLNVKETLNKFQGWPGDRPGYMVWFLPNNYQHVLKPKDLAKIANLSRIYRGSDGEVYQVQPMMP